eukprot:25925_1
MSTDELPDNDPHVFRTFSGQNLPVDAYKLLTKEEAQKQLTEEDKEEYKDPDFQLVVRSRIWGQLKNSVSERREMYKERLKLREESKQNTNLNDNNNENEVCDANEEHNSHHSSNNANEEHHSEIQQKHVITPRPHDTSSDNNSDNNNIDHGYTFIDNDNYDSHSDNNNKIIGDNNKNIKFSNIIMSNDIDNNKLIEIDANTSQTVFANPFNPLEQPLDNDNNNNNNNTNVNNDINTNDITNNKPKVPNCKPPKPKNKRKNSKTNKIKGGYIDNDMNMNMNM